MALTDDTRLYRASLVLDHIMTDARIMKVSTAIKLVRKIMNWSEADDNELQQYVVEILRKGRHPVHIRVMNERRAARRKKST